MDDARYDQMSAHDMLIYLIGVAEKTEGAEVWRALFAEILQSIDRDRAKITPCGHSENR